MNTITKKVIYVSGPISGITGNNYNEFALAQEKIEAMGHTVLNPHEICRFIDPANYADFEEHWQACMRECLSKLPYAHVLVTLKDWENSRGANMEVDTARRWGFIEVFPIGKFLSQSDNGN